MVCDARHICVAARRRRVSAKLRIRHFSHVNIAILNSGHAPGVGFALCHDGDRDRTVSFRNATQA
jgi:hypothetical protein